MRSDLVLVTAIVCLTVLGVIVAVMKPGCPSELHYVIAAIAAVLGVAGTLVVQMVKKIRGK